MEILGIGPGEFLLILVLLLVVVGPERLPGLARQAGRLLVRGRNWLQSSPDAALILRARQEIEQELATIKTSLLEVQSVRDEVIGAAKQLENQVGTLASTKVSLDDVGKIAPPAAPASNPTAAEGASPPAQAAEAPAGLEPELTADIPPVEGSAAPEAPGAPPATVQPRVEAPELRLDQRSVARPPVARPSEERPNGVEAAQERAVAAFESIELRLQAIMADLHALQAQLKQRGALADDWQPPSWNMSMPGAAGDEAGETETPTVETEEAAR